MLMQQGGKKTYVGAGRALLWRKQGSDETAGIRPRSRSLPPRPLARGCWSKSSWKVRCALAITEGYASGDIVGERMAYDRQDQPRRSGRKSVLRTGCAGPLPYPDKSL